MNNYNEVLKNAKNLQEEFGNKITLFEALQVAAQIQVSDVLSNGLQTGYANQPAFLEAIAIVLGYKPQSSETLLSVLKDKE